MPKLASKPAPTTTQSPPPEPTWLTGPALKASTEHLFATQRAKKASDRAKGKAHSGSSGGGGGRTAPVVRSKVWAEVWAEVADEGDWPELPTPLSIPMPLSPTPPALRATQDRCEVPLAALVRPVKLRGAQAKERTEFEFLPPVKNVIVLDDAESNVPEEPWEYISSAGGDDEARKIFSYAEIVSKSA